VGTVLMLNFKLQGIVFVPFLFLIYICQMEHWNWKKHFLYPVIALIATQVLLLFPFLLKEGGVGQVLHTLNSLVGYVPRVASLAFNFWTLLLGAQADIRPDTELVLAGLSFRELGFLLFAFVSFLALLPLIIFIYHKFILKRKSLVLPKELVWTAAALIAIAFFYFNTQMHERYSHPAFIFLIALFVHNRRMLLPYLLFSFAYFMNMEFVLRVMNLGNYETSFLFNRYLIAGVYGILIVYLLLYLFHLIRRQHWVSTK
jgi:hypothetical protein